jgi:capsular polysaccharide export protein
MNNLGNDKRSFVFLQGPHGPFFAQLGKMLRRAGVRTVRVGFNRGDQAFWRPKSSYIPYDGPHSEWPTHFKTLIQDHALTDLVVYGDTRPIHAQAIEMFNPRSGRHPPNTWQVDRLGNAGASYIDRLSALFRSDKACGLPCRSHPFAN